MIRLADITTRQDVWNMWKTVFGDPDNYMELYFRTKYKNENTLIYFEEEKPVASLQMLEYDFTFWMTEIPVYYLSGVCTLPEARRKGYMDKLLVRSFEIAQERNIPMMLLVPQEEWLVGFYEKYGFAKTFDSGDEYLISLKELNKRYADDLESAYVEFDRVFRNHDMTLQKTFSDFKAIMEESSLWDYPEKKSLIGMARIIDAKRLLSIYSKYNADKTFKINVIDAQLEHNDNTFEINSESRNMSIYDVDIRELTKLLLGYHTNNREEYLRTLFPRKFPQINFMME